MKLKQQPTTPYIQRGTSLLEMIIYLAVAGLVIGGAVMYGQSSGNSQAGNQHVTELNGLRSAMRTTWNGQGNYGNAVAGTYTNVNGTLITAGQVPTTLTASGTTITNKWGGAVVIQGSQAQFYVSTASVPLPVCVQLVSQAIQAGWASVSVGTTYAAGSATVVSPATASGATWCNQTGAIIYLTSN